MLKKLIAPILLLTCLGTTGVHAENWQKAGYNDMMTVYVDMDSIVRQGTTAEVRTKVVPAVTNRITHGINREVYDCQTRQTAVKSMTAFKGRKMMDQMKAKTLEWETVEPYGVSGLVFKMVCSGN